jgi:tryptophanyl-tRNA synthetase
MTNILTGLRTNTEYHIGNYLGAILPMIELQKNLKDGDKLFLFLPDLHSLESDNDKTILENTLFNTKIFLAAGFDPNREDTLIYRQSQIPAHTQLQWVLNWYTYMGEASRMTQYKDKSEKQGESIPLSLFTYPVLQAADILLYDAEIIPVGEDQRQHVELCRDIAQRFNHKHGKELFTPPLEWSKQLEFTGKEKGEKIMSLSNPTKKMSKSDENKSGLILLTDTPEIATKKIMSAETDLVGVVNWDPINQPGVTNLLNILVLLSDNAKEEVLKIWVKTTRYGDLKKEVALVVSNFLTKLQENLAKVSDQQVLSVLKIGEEKATIIASKKLQSIYNALGL